jgi:hypothetical protein
MTPSMLKKKFNFSIEPPLATLISAELGSDTAFTKME